MKLSDKFVSNGYSRTRRRSSPSTWCKSGFYTSYWIMFQLKKCYRRGRVNLLNLMGRGEVSANENLPGECERPCGLTRMAAADDGPISFCASAVAKREAIRTIYKHLALYDTKTTIMRAQAELTSRKVCAFFFICGVIRQSRCYRPSGSRKKYHRWYD